MGSRVAPSGFWMRGVGLVEVESGLVVEVEEVLEEGLEREGSWGWG